MAADGLPRVDPLKPANLATRLVRRAFDLGPLGRLLIRFAASLDPVLHPWTRSRFGRLVPMPFASLTTTGARSGLPRHSAVIYFNDGPDVILIASNYGGSRHPAWYHNLRAHPQATLARGGRGGAYTAQEEMNEPERERLFALGHRIYPGYEQYLRRTAASGRRIPIMRLHPSS